MAIRDDVAVGIDNRTRTEADEHLNLTRLGVGLSIRLQVIRGDPGLEATQVIGRDGGGGPNANDGWHHPGQHVSSTCAWLRPVNIPTINLEGNRCQQQGRRKAKHGKKMSHTSRV